MPNVSKPLWTENVDVCRPARLTVDSSCTNIPDCCPVSPLLCRWPLPRCATWPRHLCVSPKLCPPSKLSIWHSSHAFMAKLVQAFLVFFAGQNGDSQWAPTAAAETICSAAQPHCGYLSSERRQQELGTYTFSLPTGIFGVCLRPRFTICGQVIYFQRCFPTPDVQEKPKMAILWEIQCLPIENIIFP